MIGMSEGRRTVVLVEGISDRIALEALAAHRGCDLAAEGVEIVPIGGAQAIGRWVDELGPSGLDVRLAGLCDAAEEGHFRRALERAGLGSGLDRAGMQRLGFHVCDADLEDELIRALGAARVEEVLAREGDLETFRTFQNQPAWRGRPVEAQLRRWFHAADQRNSRYPPLLINALEAGDVALPLDGVLAAVG
jgi:hypothetical protein